MRLIAAIASLRLTLVGLLWLLVAVALIYRRDGLAASTAMLAPPLALLAANLLAALIANPAFRRQGPLLLFHLALLAVLLLATAGRLTYLRGEAEVVSGTEFAGLLRSDVGPLHPGKIDRIRFLNLGFEIDYKPGWTRNRTINRVRWTDDDGVIRETEIGDIVPLNLQGYRFYTTPNKGFAALVRWQPAIGASEIGSINFPSFPMHADLQESTWRLGEIDLRLRLPVNPLLIDPERHGVFKLPPRQTLQIESPLLRATLEPGQGMQLPTGRLTYLGLTTWMGYQVFYDPTLPWLLAAATLAVAALGWHFWQKFARRPWQPE